MFIFFPEHEEHLFITVLLPFELLRGLAYFLVFAGWLALLINARARNILFTLIYLEVSLLGIGLLFLTSSLIWTDGKGYIMFLIVLVVAALETALGLALFIVYHFITHGIVELYGKQLRKKQG